MRVLILGADGMLGHVVRRDFEKKGNSFFVTSRR